MRPPVRRRSYAVLAGSALALAPFVATAAPAAAATESVTLVGTLQDELGCPKDWDETCAATRLTRVGDSTAYTRTFTVPAGTYEFKVTLNGSWTENYGADGAKDGKNIPLNLEGSTRMTFTYDDATHIVSVAPASISGGMTPSDLKRVRTPLRAPATRERFYFVMADRFANGDKANDTGGLTGGRLTTGFDPADKAFYHGGDLKGITQKLDYIKGLGTSAIWLTPSFKNRAVQGPAGEESAGYHGYWITDFTQIDPHLGTNADMKSLIAAAHAKGMKVYFDIITNHTADVIDYRDPGTYSYRSKKNYPYKDASGTAFDDRDYVNKAFPAMDPATSFPYSPYFHTAADAHLKVPAWLNDPLMYHNRGNSTFAGESSTYGDFVGLDDLFTERPEVVKGMGDIYKTWVDFGIDGFRIDTVKHVNLEFWQKFIPDILGEARRVGRDDFFAFGEVYDGNPAVMSEYTTKGTLQATLDFGFQQQGDDWAAGKTGTNLADFFAKDDYYTDADSNAYQLPTFLGNHDMGRAAYMIRQAAGTSDRLLSRVRLANALMYTTRGNPVTYYGDEQGFVGTGGDQLARHDMFASKVAIYNQDTPLAGLPGPRERYDRTHVLYRHIAGLARLRASNPALADGAQIQRYAADGAGVLAWSRFDKATGREYIVAANNSTSPAKASFATWNRNERFKPVYGTRSMLRSGKDQKVSVTVPALSLQVWRASSGIDKPAAAPSVTMTIPQAGAELSGRTEVRADVAEDTYTEATFWWRPVGATTWQLVGTDDNAPYRVFHDVSGMPLGTPIEYRVVARDSRGQVGAASTWGLTAKARTSPGIGGVDNGDPVTQPTAVGVPGTHNSEMGCPKDWDETCAAAQLTLDPNDRIWKKSVTITPGSYGYKAAIDKAWTENYGKGGVKDGPNIDYETTDGTVTFYYDHATHWVTSDEEGPILTAPGSYQSALGCSKDWDAACMRPWLQDKDGDGTYTWSTKLIPAGDYEFKVAQGLSWDVNYGEGGAQNGSNLKLSVPADGATTTFSYDSATHITTVTSTTG